jgi:hypothetical protein
MKAQMTKAQMMQIAGYENEKDFYNMFPTEASFKAKYGKKLKKAQSGVNLDKNNNGVLDNLEPINMSGMGQTQNWSDTQGYATPIQDQRQYQTQYENAMQRPQLTPVSYITPAGSTNPLATGNVNGKSAFDVSGLGFQGPKEIPDGLMKGMNVINKINKVGSALGAFSEEKDLANKKGAWSGAANIQKRALISNAAIKEPDNEFLHQDDPRFIKNANELYNTQGNGTDVISQNGSEIQNTYAPNNLYDDLGYEPVSNKNYQGGGGFGNQFIPYGGGEGMNYTSNAGAQMGNALFGDIPGIGTAATLIGGALDPFTKQIRGYQNNINSVNAFAGRMNNAGSITNGLSSMGVGQNGQALKPYEDGGWVSHDWQPQVIASFGDLDEQEVYDYAHEGMDTLRAGGHMRDYTPVSDRGMETYAMGGQLKTHGIGEAETISYNPYMPGSGEMAMLRGPSHKDGGINISYGNAQNGYDVSQNGYDVSQNGGGNPGVNAEGGEPIIEMQGGGQIDPRTGQPSVEAVVLGNIPASLKLAKATGDEDLINLFTKYDGKTMKSIGNSLAKDNQKTEEYKDVVSKLVNDSDKTADGLLKNKTGEIIQLAIETRYKQNAKEQMKLANWQSSVNEFKDERSAMLGRNISAEDAGKGKETWDVDPITMDAPIETSYAKNGAFLRKAKTGITTNNADYVSKYGIVPWEGNTSKRDKYGKATASGFSAKQWDDVADKLGFKGKGNKEFQEFLLQNKESAPLIKARHQNLYGKDAWVDPEHLGYGWSADQLLLPNAAEIPTDTTTQIQGDPKNTEVIPLKQNKMGMYANMLSDFLRNKKLPGIDPRQFAGEYMAMAQNQYEPVPMQQASLQLDPMTRVSYQDIRNQNTADFRDAERNMAYDPSAVQGLLGKKYLANQQGYGEEFRTNQGLDQQIYGGNRDKVNQEQLTRLQLNANQANLQAQTKSRSKEIQQKAISSIADKYMQHDARNLEYNVNSNLFPTFGFDASGKSYVQGPGYTPNIPQVYGGKSNLKQVPVYKNGELDHYQMEEIDPNEVKALTKNGGSVNKKNKGSVVKNAKNGSIVKLHKNF